MRQIHLTNRAGRFAQCIVCHVEPRHYLNLGRTKDETMRFDVPSQRHSLECACGRSTGLHTTLERAEIDWGQRHSQLPLMLPAPVVAIRARRTRREVRHG
jgi:hypothetical protein